MSKSRRRLARGLALALGGVVALWQPSAEGGNGDLRERLERELALLRSTNHVEQGLAALARERRSNEHASEHMAHRSKETLRRLDAYRVAKDAREKQMRRRARTMYKLARGGVLKLVFEDPAARARGEQGQAGARLTKARTIRWLVTHDLRELSVHRRAQDRAGAELVSATRELAALSGLEVIADLQGRALEAARTDLDARVGQSQGARRRAKKNGSYKGLLAALGKERAALADMGRFDLLDERSLRRPVKGGVVGRFGPYEDRVLRLPMERQGIELRAKRSEQVYAIAAGQVAHVGVVPGFEEVVVLDHGGGYLSMTGRLIGVQLAVGDRVEAGEALGAVAPKTVDDGLGKTVYLEIRHGTRPIDPTDYLRRSGS